MDSKYCQYLYKNLQKCIVDIGGMDIYTVESLEFVVAQFSWNSWVPLIHEYILNEKNKK